MPLGGRQCLCGQEHLCSEPNTKRSSPCPFTGTPFPVCREGKLRLQTEKRSSRGLESFQIPRAQIIRTINSRPSGAHSRSTRCQAPNCIILLSCWILTTTLCGRFCYRPILYIGRLRLMRVSNFPKVTQLGLESTPTRQGVAGVLNFSTICRLQRAIDPWFPEGASSPYLPTPSTQVVFDKDWSVGSLLAVATSVEQTTGPSR